MQFRAQLHALTITTLEKEPHITIKVRPDYLLRLFVMFAVTAASWEQTARSVAWNIQRALANICSKYLLKPLNEARPTADRVGGSQNRPNVDTEAEHE